MLRAANQAADRWDTWTGVSEFFQLPAMTARRLSAERLQSIITFMQAKVLADAW